MNGAWRSRAFRLARPARPAWNLAKTAGQIAVFWSVFLVVIPHALVELEHGLGIAPFGPIDRAILWSVFVLSSALGLSSGYTMAVYGQGTPLPFDAPRRLVVRGPYRFIRNPMAVAGLTQGACVAGLLGSWLSLAFVVAGCVAWNYGVRPLEERHLAGQFGPDYLAYRRAVRCWIPVFPGYRGT